MTSVNVNNIHGDDMKSIFVTYWATFYEGDLTDSFMGNAEVTAFALGVKEIDIMGIEGVRYLERHIASTLNDGIEEVSHVGSVTVLNWRVF